MYELVEEAAQVLRNPTEKFDFDNPQTDPKELEKGLVETMEKYGGIGGDFRFNVIIIEELAKIGASGPGFAVHSDIVTPYFINYASEEQKYSYLPKMIKGEIITAIAMSEPGTGSDLQNIKTIAKINNNRIILNGSKTFITNGQNADLILVVAKTNPDTEVVLKDAFYKIKIYSNC